MPLGWTRGEARGLTMACWGDKLRTGCGMASWLCHPLEVAGSGVGDLSIMEAPGMEDGFWREGREDQAVNCRPPPASVCVMLLGGVGEVVEAVTLSPAPRWPGCLELGARPAWLSLPPTCGPRACATRILGWSCPLLVALPRSCPWCRPQKAWKRRGTCAGLGRSQPWNCSLA